jgi:hypothetical protein
MIRGIGSIILTIVLAAVVLALYLFLGKAQLTRAIRSLSDRKEALVVQQLELARMEAEMPKMVEELPTWRKQLNLFKSAIPEKINDHQFLKNLNEQLELNHVKLQDIQVATAGSWFKDTDEKTIKALREMELDVDTMRKVQVAYYDIRLTGEFKDVITCFENLKRYGRLYTIDLITTETGGGGGSVTQIVDPAKRPIMLSGALFYGIPEDYMDSASMERLFQQRYSGPLARRVFQSIMRHATSLDRQPPGKGAGNGKPNNPAGAPARGSERSTGNATGQGA